MFVILRFENFMFVWLVGFLFVTTRQLKLNHMYMGQIV